MLIFRQFGSRHKVNSGKFEERPVGRFEEKKSNQYLTVPLLFVSYFVFSETIQSQRYTNTFKAQYIRRCFNIFIHFLKHQRDSLKKCKTIFVAACSFFARTIPNIFVLLRSASFFELETEGADSGCFKSLRIFHMWSKFSSRHV